jgi:hypothetical protein
VQLLDMMTPRSLALTAAVLTAITARPGHAQTAPPAWAARLDRVVGRSVTPADSARALGTRSNFILIHS